MKRTIVITALAAAGLAAALHTGADARGAVMSTAGCVPGVKKVEGVAARTFCGPARGMIRINGRTISYRGGECSKSIGLFAVNIGTVVLGNLAHRPEYRGVTSEPTAGAHAKQTVSVVHGGKSVSLVGTVTLGSGLRAGTFSGKAFGSATTISGSFTC